MGLFRIGTAARLVGVEVATLRNWEQRYRVVLAERSPGRQRLYSNEEIVRLRAIKQWIDQGLSAGEAHSLLRDPAPLNNAAPGQSPAWWIRAEARRVRAEAAATHARAAAAQASAAHRLDALADQATDRNSARFRELAERARERQQRTNALAEQIARPQTLSTARHTGPAQRSNRTPTDPNTVDDPTASPLSEDPRDATAVRDSGDAISD